MEDLSLHILDIVENSLAAGARRVEIRIEEDLKADRMTLEIVDDGSGMDEMTVQNVLDPFFTTKPVGKGTGLGLSVSYNIIKKHQGEIQVSSQLNKGTTFKIVLPIAGAVIENA